MTPLPKRRLSTARQGHRRQSIKLTVDSIEKCSNCGQMTRPHKVCVNCGYYKGKLVKTIKTKASKADKSAQ